MWELIVSVPDHYLTFSFVPFDGLKLRIPSKLLRFPSFLIHVLKFKVERIWTLACYGTVLTLQNKKK